MSTTVKSCWLKDRNGEKLAPKTLASQVQMSDGTLLEDKIIEAANSSSPEIYVGDGEMPETATVQILLDGSDEEQALKDELKEYIDGEIEKVTPVKGVDYFDGQKGEAGKSAYEYAKEGGYDGTEAAFTHDINPDNIKANSIEFISTELAKRGQLKPEFANDVSECTDTSKLYVLPDGYIWAYMKKAQAIPHNANDGTCVRNKRPTSSSLMTENTAHNGYFSTSPIAIDSAWETCVVNISGVEKLVQVFYSTFYVHYYNGDGSYIGYKHATAWGLSAEEQPLPISVDIASNNDFFASASYVRVALAVSTGSITESTVSNIVINVEPLNQYTYEYGWYSTGHMFNTDDYGQAIEKNASDIEDLFERVGDIKKTIEEGLPSNGDTNTTPLFNKLGLIGDSLTNQEYQKWQETVVNMLNIPTWHKNAITGSTVARYSDTTLTPFVERYLDTPEDCDCVVIMGGTNDSKKDGEHMGEVGVLTNDTFKGAYSTIIEGLLTRNPATRVMLMTPPRSYSTSLVLHTRIEKYAEATKEIAKFYGLPCLDLYNTLGWNAKTAEWCSWNFAANDTVHFSNGIGPRVGRMVANFIRNNY